MSVESRSIKALYDSLSIMKSIGLHPQNPAVVETKQKLRQMQKARHFGPKILRDRGIDGYITKETLPEYLSDRPKEDAVNWFNDNRVFPENNSMYDCTGKPFTSWFTIIRRHGRWVAFHDVGFDV